MYVELLSVQNKWNNKFPVSSTNLVSNRDLKTEVRTEPWLLCTVTPLVVIYMFNIY